MSHIENLIKCIDDHLEKNNQEYMLAPDANDLLEKMGLLRNSSQRSGKPLRDLLRNGKIPHAYQIGRIWHIPHSCNKQSASVTQSDFMSKTKLDSILESINVNVGNTQIKNDIQHGRRSTSDEYYVIGLCNEALKMTASQQHHFDFLRGDKGTLLPVDAFYEDLNLVVEYYEKQHTESVAFFDKKETISGVDRGTQRRMYDEKRKIELPKHGIKLVVINYSDFGTSKKLSRHHDTDLEIVRRILKENGVI